MHTFIKKLSLFIIVFTTTFLSTHTFAASPLFDSSIPSKPEYWWSPASPENGGNGIAVNNETTAEISVTTKHQIPTYNRTLVVRPKSYGEYFNPSSEVSREYGTEYHGLSGRVDSNSSERQRKIFLFCGKGSQVVLQSHGFIGHTAKITMTGNSTGSVNIPGHHNTTYTVRWEWVYQYNIKERGMEFPYTRTICVFTITSSQTHHHE